MQGTPMFIPADPPGEGENSTHVGTLDWNSNLYTPFP